MSGPKVDFEGPVLDPTVVGIRTSRVSWGSSHSEVKQLLSGSAVLAAGSNRLLHAERGHLLETSANNVVIFFLTWPNVHPESLLIHHYFMFFCKPPSPQRSRGHGHEMNVL